MAPIDGPSPPQHGVDILAATTPKCGDCLELSGKSAASRAPGLGWFNDYGVSVGLRRLKYSLNGGSDPPATLH